MSPEWRSGYLFVANTIGDPGSKDQKGDTPRLNRAIRDHLFRNVFPLLAKGD